MELPFTVVFQPPSLTELRACLRLRRVWASVVLVVLAVGAGIAAVTAARADAGASQVAAPLRITSRPAGASVVLDGRERGRSPLDLLVAPGHHTVQITGDDILHADYAIDVPSDGAAIEAVLWRRRPGVIRLRPSVPGASLSDVQLLPDGSLALSVALPPGQQLEAWRLEPVSGGLEPLARALSGSRLAVAADGASVAFLGYEIGPSPNPLLTSGRTTAARVVWIQSPGVSAPAAVWRAPATENLVDVSWTPAGDGLLVTTREPLAADASRDHLWLVDRDGRQQRELATLPSQVVAGSESWSRDGQRLAFLAHAGSLTALCLLDLDGAFRYVADLEPSEAPPLPYAPVAWSSDSQRLLFVAPAQQVPTAPLMWPAASPPNTLYTARVDEPAPAIWSEANVALPAWRDDGRIIGLGRSADTGDLALRSLAQDGAAETLLTLPLRPHSRYAAAWAADRTGVLVAMESGGGLVDYTYVLLGAEERR